MIDNLTIIRYDAEGKRPMEDPVIRELRANLVINGELYLSMMCLPQNFEELAVGFMFSEGLIKSYADIKNIDATCTGNIFVFTHQPVVYNKTENRVLVSGCANGSVNLAFLNEANLQPLASNLVYGYDEIVDMMSKFSKQSPIFTETGAVHSAALLFKNGKGHFFEDIGRHNAVDKVVGAALMQQLPIKEGVLLVSGRVSSEIALKTSRLGIPVMVSQSAPTSMSVAIAEKVGMTLVGFARGRRFNVYSGDSRISS
ncbi:MAG: formate dehydrogenase accessory sulfurtransferase FdhD [Defluviitaleaceae bacterium]|nr:formate dehydrogenase accessory sulfurtransferase FdhD [Defluviitaleaceae bacterium]